MSLFLVALYRPTDYDPATEDAAMLAEISALNDAMVAAGVRAFVGGLGPLEQTKAIRTGADRSLRATDGPFAETKEYIGGFWVLDTATMDEALDWGRKAAVACRGGIEVRPLFQ